MSAILAGPNNPPPQSFNVSALRLEDLYRSSKLRRRNESTALLWAAYLTSVFVLSIIGAPTTGFFITALGIISLNILLARFCFKALENDNSDEQIIQDIFQENRKKIVFQTSFLGFLGIAGYSTFILDINS